MFPRIRKNFKEKSSDTPPFRAGSLHSYRHGTSDLQQLRGAADSLSQTRNQLHQEYYTLIAASLDLEKELNVPFGSLGNIK
jgi:hypothetical protein